MNPEIIRARRCSRTGEIRFQRAKWHCEIKTLAHLQTEKTTRRNADHFGRPAVHNYVAANRRIPPRKFAQPQSVTDHGSGRAATHAVVLCSKKASAQRINPQRIECVAA